MYLVLKKIFPINKKMKTLFIGVDCENDLNGCEASPCSVGRNCSDRNADEHKANPSLKPYTCTPCPVGYTDVNDKCEGIAYLIYEM